MNKQTAWLTPAAHERLTRELAVLTGAPVSPDVAAEFAVSADKGVREARAARIKEILADAVIGEPPADDGVAEPGMVLTVRYGDEEETETFLLGVRDRSDSETMDVYSPESPLGLAIIGAREGEERTYLTPRGQSITLTLVKAVPYEADK